MTITQSRDPCHFQLLSHQLSPPSHLLLSTRLKCHPDTFVPHFCENECVHGIEKVRKAGAHSQKCRNCNKVENLLFSFSGFFKMIVRQFLQYCIKWNTVFSQVIYCFVNNLMFILNDYFKLAPPSGHCI